MRRSAEEEVIVFKDRVDAGRRLAARLEKYKDEPAVVYGLPRGGVPVAAEVAKALSAPLDLLLVRKIGAPMQPELALGAVVDGGAPIIVRNENLIRLTGTSEKEFDTVCARELAEIERRRRQFAADLRPRDPANKIAIVVDDGIATGATMRAALQATRRRKPKTLVLAVPVAAEDAVASLKGDADEVVCLEMPPEFGAIGYFYEDFHQLADADVTEILKRFQT